MSAMKPRFDRIARVVFYFEAIFINLGVGVVCFFAPGWFTSNFVPQGMPVLGLELIRWYGVLLLVLAYAALRTLPLQDSRPLRYVIEALLFGDVAHLAASMLYLRAGGVQGIGTVFMFGMATFLAVVRSGWLLQKRGEG